jgi:Predicted metal-dependent phosphoesterases (PHP family)
MNADLHLHSNHSDGNWSPAEMVLHAVKCKMNVIALTDHDTVSGVPFAHEAALSLSAEPESLEIVPGVEINTIWHDDAGDAHDVHILGHFICIKNDDLLALLQRQRDARVAQAQEMVEKFAATGVPLTMTMIEELAGSSPIGKPHITRAVVAAGGVSDINDAYNTIFKKSSPFYVKRKSASPVDAVKAIVTAGGVATVAHPGEGEHVESMIRELQKAGLSGIEVYHRFHSEELIARHMRLAEELGLIVTGGSDCHGPFEEHPSLMGTMHVPPDAVERLRAMSRAV